MKKRESWYLHTLPELIYNVIWAEARPLTVHQIREILVYEKPDKYQNKQLTQALTVQKIVGAITTHKYLFRKVGVSQFGNRSLWAINTPTYEELMNKKEGLSVLGAIEDNLDYADLENMDKDEIINLLNEIVGLSKEAMLLLE